MKTKETNSIALEFYYDKQDLMTRECLLALKSMIMKIDDKVVHKRKYQIPFFCYNNFNLGFLWVHRKKIVVGFIEDSKIIPANKEQKKDFIQTLELNPAEDIPVLKIKKSIEGLISKYKAQSI